MFAQWCYCLGSPAVHQASGWLSSVTWQPALILWSFCNPLEPNVSLCFLHSSCKWILIGNSTLFYLENRMIKVVDQSGQFLSIRTNFDRQCWNGSYLDPFGEIKTNSCTHMQRWNFSWTHRHCRCKISPPWGKIGLWTYGVCCKFTYLV